MCDQPALERSAFEHAERSRQLDLLRAPVDQAESAAELTRHQGTCAHCFTFGLLAFFFFFFSRASSSSSSGLSASIHVSGCRFHHGQSGKQICVRSAWDGHGQSARCGRVAVAGYVGGYRRRGAGCALAPSVARHARELAYHCRDATTRCEELERQSEILLQVPKHEAHQPEENHHDLERALAMELALEVHPRRAATAPARGSASNACVRACVRGDSCTTSSPCVSWLRHRAHNNDIMVSWYPSSNLCPSVAPQVASLLLRCP